MAKRKPLQTKKTNRYVRPTVIVLGDGKTEKSYINKLKELDLFNNVHLKYEEGSELNFKKKIKEHANNKNVIVIIDVDNAESNSIKYNAIKKLVDTKKYKGQIFFNNYSFELWLLNHIDYFSKPVTDKTQYDKEINDIFGIESWSKYKNERNRNQIMKLIDHESIQSAVPNIKGLNKKKPFKNPSSNMDEWVNKIKKIK
jgi:hypothetical protein